MKCFPFYLCFFLFLILAVESKTRQAQSDGIYVVYMGAAAANNNHNQLVGSLIRRLILLKIIIIIIIEHMNLIYCRFLHKTSLINTNFYVLVGCNKRKREKHACFYRNNHFV